MSMICELFIIPPQTARQLVGDPGSIHDVLQALEGSDSVLSLEKSWHGLHFALYRDCLGGEPASQYLVWRRRSRG